MESVQELAAVTGVSCACRTLGVARSTLYRSIPEAVWINPPDPQNAQQQLLTNFQTELSLCTGHNPATDNLN